ncbi:MAG: hypothetical protein EPN94_03770 [Nitrospirae bacterium]|nr:MAG: hypothetical protein EPN94_03770 [Nitrospirota bacterium]
MISQVNKEVVLEVQSKNSYGLPYCLHSLKVVIIKHIMNRFLIFFICMMFPLVFAGCSREPQKPKEPSAAAKGEVAQEKQKPESRPPAEKEISARTTLLATIADDEKPQAAVAIAGHGMPPASSLFQVFFSESGRGAAYIAEKNGKTYVVHNGKAGKQYANVGTVALSPDGQRIAYGAIVDGKWRMVIDGKEGKSYNAVGTPLFSPDSKHVAYKAMLGERWFIAVDNAVNSGTKANYAKQEFNADSTLIAYVENADDKNKGRLVVSDLGFKTQTSLDGVGLPMITNTDKTRIAAVSISDNKQRVIEFSFSAPRAVKKGPLYDAIHNLAFGPDGVSLAYDAERAGAHLLIFNDREDGISKGTLVGPPVIRPDLKAVGAIIAKNDPASQHVAGNLADNSTSLHQSFINAAGKGKEYEEAAGLVYNRDGSIYAYVARTGQGWFVVVNGEEGPVFDRVVTPVFSPDGKLLVYRARKDGKRFVVVADTKGKTIKQHPAYEQVFQPVFTPDGKSVGYGVKDGQKLIWKVENLDK